MPHPPTNDDLIDPKKILIMAFTDEFVCTEVRFKFWNGKKTYTVEYSPSSRTWYIFDEGTQSNCLAKYTLSKREAGETTLDNAQLYLNTYFTSIKSDFYA